MEIEKRREITWTLKFSGQNISMEIRAAENLGTIESFSISMIEGDKNIGVNLQEEQFLNFLSILNGFQRGVIGESQQEMMDDLLESSPEEPSPSAIPQDKNMEMPGYGNSDTIPTEEQVGSSTSESGDKREPDSPDLDPREWDPW